MPRPSWASANSPTASGAPSPGGTTPAGIANTSRGVAFEKREFLPDEAKEFQVRMDRLGKGELKLMVELHADDTAASPPGARADAPAGWFTLRPG